MKKMRDLKKTDFFVFKCQNTVIFSWFVMISLAFFTLPVSTVRIAKRNQEQKKN